MEMHSENRKRTGKDPAVNPPVLDKRVVRACEGKQCTSIYMPSLAFTFSSEICGGEMIGRSTGESQHRCHTHQNAMPKASLKSLLVSGMYSTFGHSAGKNWALREVGWPSMRGV